MKNYKLVEIEWEDSRLPTSEWQFIKNANISTICKCKTVGYLIKRTNKKITVAQSIGDLNSNLSQANGIMTIPACCVIDVKEI